MPNPGFIAGHLKPASGGGLASFSDDFNRANSDSLGANWTEFAGDVDIASNEAVNPLSFGNDIQGAAYTGTACTTVDQFVKVTLSATSGANSSPGVVLRYTDASSPFYVVRFDSANNVMRWVYHSSAADVSGTIIDSAAFTVSFPLVVGVTIIGTGTSTVIRGWSGPTANAPGSSGTTWDGAGPTASITTDPSPAVNTGSYVGIGGSGALGLAWDNFFGGDVP